MLDLRLPIGYFFIVNSVLLIAYGLATPVATAIGAYAINLNVIWGAVFGVFGVTMILIARLSRSPGAKKPSSSSIPE
jgi:hypothetical protein